MGSCTDLVLYEGLHFLGDLFQILQTRANVLSYISIHLMPLYGSSPLGRRLKALPYIPLVTTSRQQVQVSKSRRGECCKMFENFGPFLFVEYFIQGIKHDVDLFTKFFDGSNKRILEILRARTMSNCMMRVVKFLNCRRNPSLIRRELSQK